MRYKTKPGTDEIIPNEYMLSHWNNYCCIAFAGLDPVVSQSGRFQNISGRISKRVSPLIVDTILFYRTSIECGYYVQPVISY